MKQSNMLHVQPATPVAPHAGAWIETDIGEALAGTATVAPHAGAWIETPMLIHRCLAGEVAPHAGAWIETTTGRSAK